ncbi:MAG: DUF2752 domain-containing protein [Deltaproteobacteria bacterium]|nr:MAG: DUF2752 domain-containing protein [Deltaproteobacteria bacterium]
MIKYPKMKSIRQHPLAAQNIFQITGNPPHQSGKNALIFKPVLAATLPNQRTLRLITAGAMLQLGVTLASGQGWQCPVYANFAIPCPGCGLSTAIILLIRGSWQTALSVHAFAPVFLMLIIFMGILSALPHNSYRIAVQRLAVLERNYCFAGWLVIGLIVYWGVRVFGSL